MNRKRFGLAVVLCAAACAAGAANLAPVVSLTAPANNAVFTAPANLTLMATARDPDGTIARVEFFRGNSLLATDTTAPYSALWSNVPAGSYTLTARATDNKGKATVSAAVKITVNALPVATLTAPANNTVFSAPFSTTLQATATDADGTVSRVAFLDNGGLVGTDATKPYSAFWSSRVLGPHTLGAQATDNRGAAGPISARTVTVRHAKVDANANGVADVLEDIALAAPAQFMDAPFVVAGTIEAEQFDKGGQNTAYFSAADNATKDYRVTRVAIEPCNDPLGGGYCVSKLRPGDWLRYTFQAVRAGKYTLEVRAAGGAPNTTFNVEFGNANGQAGYQTPALTIPSTNWERVACTEVNLPAGTNYFKLRMLSAPAGVVGRINHLSLYPTVADNVTPPYTVAVPGLVEGAAGAALAVAQANTLAVQAAVNDVLLRGGGTVQFPAGVYYLAQAPHIDPIYWEWIGNNGGMTYAVVVLRQLPADSLGSNIRIAGDPAGGTLLQAQNRAVTMFYAANTFGIYQSQSYTNITFENLTLQGAPHTRRDGSFEPGWFSTIDTNTGDGGFLSVGSLIVVGGSGVDGNYPDRPARNVVIRNCTFMNTTRPIVMWGVENMAVRHCRFLFYTGEYPHGLAVGEPLIRDGVTYNSDGPAARAHVGIFGAMGGQGVNNFVLTDSFFDGSVTGDGTIRNDFKNADYTDGILWLQQGGNWFCGWNVVSNYVLEAVQYNGGPGTVAGNRFGTYPYTRSTCALNLTVSAFNSVTRSQADLSYGFTGNCVRGGRLGVLSVYWASDYDDPLIDLHACGNDVQVDLPPSGVPWGELIGAVVEMGNGNRVNVAGNTLRGGGIGYRAELRHVSLELLKNDFRAAVTDSVSFDGLVGSLSRAVLARNALGLGAGAHLKISATDAPSAFLLKNTYFNAAQNPLVDPVLNPAGAPVYLQY